MKLIARAWAETAVSSLITFQFLLHFLSFSFLLPTICSLLGPNNETINKIGEKYLLSLSSCGGYNCRRLTWTAILLGIIDKMAMADLPKQLETSAAGQQKTLTLTPHLPSLARLCEKQMSSSTNYKLELHERFLQLEKKFKNLNQDFSFLLITW